MQQMKMAPRTKATSTRRTAIVLVAASAALFLPSAQSLSTITRPVRVRSAVDAPIELRIRQKVAPKTKTSDRAPSSVSPEQYSWYDEDPSLYFDMEESVTTDLKELQQSTGSDILDTKLQQQLDGISHPNQFLDVHVADATIMEKIAMSSVTQQLPKAAVDALLARSIGARQPKRANGQKGIQTLQFAGHRVTHEEEIELARIIQKGAALEAAREKGEEKQGRLITRQEWADMVGMPAKELRREIARYRQAKHLLVTANIGLVHAVVNQYWAKNKDRYLGISKEELIQEGSLGLLRAAELFDPSRGLRFSTYAVVWIKGTLSNSHVQELVRVPDRERRRWSKIQQAQSDLEKLNDGNKAAVTLELLSEHTGISPQDILFTQRKMNQARSVLSLDYEQASQTRSGTESKKTNNVENDKAMRDDVDMVERTQLQADIIATMARNLDAREARLVRLRYGLSDGVTRSLQECAEAMGLSYTRVNQLSKQCLKKLREAAEAESLQEYLLTIA